jgi:hypothetical protein
MEEFRNVEINDIRVSSFCQFLKVKTPVNLVEDEEQRHGFAISYTTAQTDGDQWIVTASFKDEAVVV